MMKRFLRSKLVLSLIAFIIVGGIVAIPLSNNITRAHAASRSSHNIAYVTYDDSGFTGASIPSGNIFTDAIVGGPAPTSSPTDSVTYNGMTFTPLAQSALSTTTLASYDTLILFEVCDIATSLTPSQHDAINAYLAAGNKIILYDADRCAASEGGVADYSWFTYPFATSSPGPLGASGTLTVVENSTLTQGLASDPFNSDELGDANTATTSDPHWFAAAKTTNTLGNNGYFLAYARNTGLIIYDGADHWYTDGPTQSLTDLFLNELNQQYDPDNLPSTTPIAGTVNYIALGDSFSSGEGNPSFFTGTDGPNDFCHRSQHAYSQVLGMAYNLTPEFYACSGATTANITTKMRYGEQPQITDPGVNNTAGLVTMTIGGNDVGFGDVLKTCIALRLVAGLYNLRIGPIANWLGFGLDPSCADYKGFVNSENARIANVISPVKRTYTALLGKVSASDTSVIVADYPHLFPDSAKQQSCFDLAPFLTTADQRYFNIAGDQLDNVLKSAAGQAGVNFVDVRSNFNGHGLCGSGGTWINSIGTALFNGSGAVGAFHPNVSGQTNGYADAFESYIKSATNRTPEGYPADPTPLLASSSTVAPTATPTDAVQQLTVQPVTTGTTSCEGIYTAGQQLSVSGDGFAPGVTVPLYITSPGLSSHGEQQVGQLTADATGHIAGTISIPLTATGFTVKGSNAGLFFVDAIGSGPGGVHNDDVAMEGLASPGSSCGTGGHLPFHGFEAPVANFPHVNKVEHGQPITIEFSIPGVNEPINNILAKDYPQSAPVSCSSPSPITTGTPTQSINVNDPNLLSSEYKYVWKTNPSWRGCREFIVKLVDGTYHQAVFDFTE